MNLYLYLHNLVILPKIKIFNSVKSDTLKHCSYGHANEAT